MTYTKTAFENPSSTLYAFRLSLEWKGQKGEVDLVATSKDDACDYFRANARKLAYMPASSLQRVALLYKIATNFSNTCVDA